MLLKSKDKLTELNRLGLVVIPVSGLIILLFLIPSLWGDYARILLFTILLYVTMALSYDVVGGLLGYLYLGHGLFFGLGAYTTALASLQIEIGSEAQLNTGKRRSGRISGDKLRASKKAGINLQRSSGSPGRRTACTRDIFCDPGRGFRPGKFSCSTAYVFAPQARNHLGSSAGSSHPLRSPGIYLDHHAQLSLEPLRSSINLYLNSEGETKQPLGSTA